MDAGFYGPITEIEEGNRYEDAVVVNGKLSR